MKVVPRKKAKALKGDRSLSYQLITPDTVGSRKFLITVVDVKPGGSTPLHEHRTVESMYYIIEGRGEVSSRREKKIVGPDTAVYFHAGTVWALQGVGVILGSFMSNNPTWIWIGAVTAVIGLGLAAFGLRSRASA